MTSTRPTNRYTRIVKTAGTAAFWLFLWYLAAMYVGQELILPSPAAVIRELGTMIVTGQFWLNTLMTLARILAGYLAGIILASLLVLLTSRFSLADVLLSPVIRIIRSTPVASFIILALLWMGKSWVPVLIVTLMVIPVIWENTVAELKAVDGQLVEMGRAYRFSKWQMFRYIYLPSVLPGFMSACLNAMGLAWKSGIGAEVISQPSRAIGSNLYYSKVYLDTAKLFGWTAVVIIASMLIEKLIRKVVSALGSRGD